MSEALGVVARSLKYVAWHPFRFIALAVAAGVFVDAPIALALGIVAAATVLIATPNGARKQRELEHHIDRMLTCTAAGLRRIPFRLGGRRLRR
jgi:hypothetical protein